MPAKKIDPIRPFYALVGATDLAVEYARNAATEAQTRFAKVEIEPKALREQALTAVTSRIDELAEDAKEAPAKVEAYAEKARTQVETYAEKARTQVETYLNDTVAEVNETYGELEVRGRDLVARIRHQQATQDAKAATKTTVAKAKTARTQTTKSAKASTASTRKTARTGAKATTTSAKKAAAATVEAIGDAAEKVGD